MKGSCLYSYTLLSVWCSLYQVAADANNQHLHAKQSANLAMLSTAAELNLN